MTDETSSRRKSTPGDASMRRSIQDLVVSIDPNIKIEPEVEDVRQLLSLPRHSCAHLFHHSFFWILPMSSLTRSPILGAASPSTAVVTR